jgi:bisphosphoglycerate-independent phosphoglycerate mutase (AlkP superfamily)
MTMNTSSKAHILILGDNYSRLASAHKICSWARRQPLGTERGFADVEPTVLGLLGLAQPLQMTGRSILLKAALAGGDAKK